MVAKKINDLKLSDNEEFARLCKEHVLFKIKDPYTETMFEPILGSILDGNNFSLKLAKKDIDTQSLMKIINNKDLLTGIVNHHNKVIGINFKMLYINGSEIICSYPEKVFLIDARKMPRYSLINSTIAPISALVSVPEISLRPLDVPIFDISIQGFSLVVIPSLLSTFTVGRSFEIINIKILGNMITVKATVMNSFKLDDKNHKVGFKFNTLNQSNTKIIEKYLENLIK